MQALPETEGKLAENIIHFARALRRAGVKVGPAQVLSAIEAVDAAGFTQREDFYNILKATLVCRPEQFATFHQVFTLFWRDPEFLTRFKGRTDLLAYAAEHNIPVRQKETSGGNVWNYLLLELISLRLTDGVLGGRDTKGSIFSR